MAELKLELEDFIEFSNEFSEELRAISEDAYWAVKKTPSDSELQEIISRAEKMLKKYYDLPNRIKHSGQLDSLKVHQDDIEDLESDLKKLKNKANK